MRAKRRTCRESAAAAAPFEVVKACSSVQKGVASFFSHEKNTISAKRNHEMNTLSLTAFTTPVGYASAGPTYIPNFTNIPSGPTGVENSPAATQPFEGIHSVIIAEAARSSSLSLPVLLCDFCKVWLDSTSRYAVITIILMKQASRQPELSTVAYNELQMIGYQFIRDSQILTLLNFS